MSQTNRTGLEDVFSAWAEYTPSDWKESIATAVEFNYRHHPAVAAAIAKFEAENPDVDLDHLPLMATVISYAAPLAYAMARTYPDGIESFDTWIERAWAFCEFGEPVGEPES